MAEQKRTSRRYSTRTKAVEGPIEDAYGHLQPQNLDLEEAVLGALMIEKDAYSLVSEILRPESFYDHRHQLIYEAIRALSLQQKPVDILTVSEHLGVMGRLEEVTDILSKKRNSEFVLPRQVVMYLCRNMLDISLSNLAKILCKKDHTTIIHGINKVEAELSTNEEFRNKLEIIKKKLNPS